jgi:hypothetical protein
MKRREFITLLGGEAGVAARGVGAGGRGSVVGALVLAPLQLDAVFTDNLRRGLGMQGFVDSQNVVVDIR